MQKSWDDIDIGGLSMETPEQGTEKIRPQRQERISSKEIAVIVLEQKGRMEVAIDNLSGKKECAGLLLDISSGGAKLLVLGFCREADVLRISFKVGKRGIVCRARVAWARQEEQGLLAGVQFLAPNAADIEYIRSLVCAKHLK
jgi:hypothetical protein